jgi:hypothetical protein
VPGHATALEGRWSLGSDVALVSSLGTGHTWLLTEGASGDSVRKS